MKNDDGSSSRSGTQRGVAIGLFLTIALAGFVWGPSGYRAIRYRFYEKFEPPGGGTVSFIAYRGEEGMANALYAPNRASFAGSAGKPPLILTVGPGPGTMVFLFPGAQADFVTDEFIFRLEGSVEAQNAAWQRLLDRRKERYPDLDWEQFRGWVLEQGSKVPWGAIPSLPPVQEPPPGPRDSILIDEE